MRSALLVALALGLSGCGDDPVDAAGDYSVNLTNGDNECMLDGWTAGETASGIPFRVQQDGADVTGTIEGLVGTWVNATFGGRTFQGRVSGSHLDMTLFGTRSFAEGSCASTVNIDLDADLTGDVLVGVLRYTAQTNGSPDCPALLATCANEQSFNGARPPTD